jgi:hypothetical protein
VRAFIEFSIPSSTPRCTGKTGVNYIGHGDKEKPRHCHALAGETAGMTPGSWRMVDTIARRMGIPFDAAIAYSVERGWLIAAGSPPHRICLTDDARRVCVS